MKGIIILAPDLEQLGIIRGADDKRYYFQVTDLLSKGKIQVGYEADFEPQKEKATEICVLTIAAETYSGHSTTGRMDLEKLQEVATGFLKQAKMKSGNLQPIKNIPGVIASSVFLIALMLPLFNLNVMGANYGYHDDVDLTNNVIMTFLILIALGSIVLFAFDLNRLYVKVANVALLVLFIGLTVIAFSSTSEINQMGASAQNTLNQFMGGSTPADTPDMGNIAKVIPHIGFYLAIIALGGQFYFGFFKR